MTIGTEEIIKVIVENTEDQSRLSPKRNVDKSILMGYLWRPSVESVCNQARDWRIWFHQLSNKLIHMGRDALEVSLSELSLVSVPVQFQRQAVGDRLVADVEALRLAGPREYIFFFFFFFAAASSVGLRVGDLVVDGLGVDEGDGEANWS